MMDQVPSGLELPFRLGEYKGRATLCADAAAMPRPHGHRGVSRYEWQER